MTEEQVTKAILKWLLAHGWKIVCFDFPQSGTGRLLHSEDAMGTKNKGTINPDIVAVKGAFCLFFENKDRFYYPDYEKVHRLIVHNSYVQAIAQLLDKYPVTHIYYGIGLPAGKHGQASKEAAHLVDFIVGVQNDQTVSVLYYSCPDIFTD